ncbi:MAG: L,D-transpeptidase [Candidatus Dormibacteraeota bacterium]|nr:L,D-transpeptidase [Candidatus Dormibacteraeota bacterium]
MASGRHSTFAAAASSLEKQWNKDEAAGVPAANIATLRKQLDSSTESHAGSWSPQWWGDTGDSLINQLQGKTNTLWAAAMSAGRTQAEQAVKLFGQLSQQLGSYIPSSMTAAEATWESQITAASTPNQLKNLARTWVATVAATRAQAQQAQLAAQLDALNSQATGFDGVAGLVQDAQDAVNTADADNLDTGDVPALITAVQNDVQDSAIQNADASSAIQQLVTADSQLHSLISLNDNVNGQIRPLEYSVDQAAAENTPNQASLMGQYQGVQSSFTAARTTAQLTAVQTAISTLQNSVATELAADVCGHPVGAGKVLTFNLALQEGVFYQDGCVVKATPVTTGRAELRTPTGTFSTFNKQSPFQFISPWPPSSPFYYYPSWVNYVIEFASGGYFIHDAPWESAGDYGPGGEDSAGASHGCIHVPSDVMTWLYAWTPTGVPVIIT